MELEDALMLEKKLVLKDNRITLMGTRWAILPVRFIGAISNPAHAKGVYEAGKEGGYETATRIGEEEGMEGPALAEFLISALPEFGWGNIEKTGIDAAKKQATLHLETGNPLLRGMLAGMFKAAFGEDVDAEETADGTLAIKK